jgi:hypothetical protein
MRYGITRLWMTSSFYPFYFRYRQTARPVLQKKAWRMPYCGMLRRVVLVGTAISEERIIRVTRNGKLGTTFPVTSNRRTLLRNTTA